MNMEQRPNEFSSEHENGHDIACVVGEPLSEEQKDRLWNEFEFMRRMSKDPSSHFGEMGELSREDLSDWEWYVWSNLKNLTSEEINEYRDLSFEERPSTRESGSNGKTDPRDNFYGLMLSFINNKNAEKYLERKSLWSNVEAMCRTSADPDRYAAELNWMRWKDLTDVEWELLNDLMIDWGGMNEAEIAERRARSFSEHPPIMTMQERDPRDNFYDLMLSLVKDKQAKAWALSGHF